MIQPHRAGDGTLIRFQVIEREGAGLHRLLLGAMRSGELRTFVVKRRGRRVQHRSPSIPGWLKWSDSGGILLCEIVSPRSPENEWHLFSAFLGRLAHRYADHIHSISVQFGADAGEAPRRRATRPAASRRARRRRAGSRRRSRPRLSRRGRR
jgi:hypothetical protein